MLAQRFAGILPPMTTDEALESAAVLSLVGQFAPQRWATRIFRAPHHTASAAALCGGGSPPMPGEISLAHHGVLFLDELPEFERRVLESLRQPLESGAITVSRAARQVDYPARFQLIGAMNPCPCGFYGHATLACRCTPDMDCIHQIKEGNRSIVGLMLESHLHGGNQSIPDDLKQLKYGVSVTDACVDWSTTAELLRRAATELRPVLAARGR